MAKTIKEINERIKRGEAIVVTAEEIIDLSKNKSKKDLAKEVDVVTTGTFGPMCSSGAYFNIGHAKPRIKIGGGQATLNNVPAYAGFAAVDIYLGATAVPDDDPRNKIFPGEFRYGGAHVIEDLVSGKDVRLVATTYGTNCYPRRHLETWINLKDLNEAVLLNPRNAYQNYNVAVNISNKTIYTYMGVLRLNLGNATYCSAGQLSPLLNDPFYKTIGIGTRIFLGGGVGHIYFWGTQHNPGVVRTDKGIPRVPAGTIAVCGDLKEMSPQFLRGVSMYGYGTTLAVGIGIPIPIFDEEILSYTLVKDEDIFASVVDYSESYPQMKPETLGEVNYKQLKSGKIEVKGKEIRTSGLSSYKKAREISQILKNWIKEEKFLLSEPLAPLPSPQSGYKFKGLPIRPLKGDKDS